MTDTLFLIHLSLAESSEAYEMKIHLVWFADFLYSFVSTFKILFWANMSINTSLD